MSAPAGEERETTAAPKAPAARRTWHLVTCEFAPRLGGVADFTRVVAGLLASDWPVHVWAPAPASSDRPGVVVHPLPRGFAATALRSLDRALDACDGPRRLFVQWVPHGYGYKSLNLPFCLWVRRRARRGDEVHLMVHEPFLPFDARRLRQNVGAVAHRVMLRALLGAASRVWVATPSFVPDVTRHAPGPIAPSWLPIPSPLAPLEAPEAVRRLRAELAGGAPVVGHFGTCNALVAPVLAQVLERLTIARRDLRFVVVGRETREFVDALVAAGRLPRGAVVASGEQIPGDLSQLIQCCDVFVQPYHDGVSTRRTTLMALLDHAAAVVTAAGPRTETYWADSGAVRLLPEGNPALFERAVLDLLDRPADAAALRARARARYLADFDARHVRAALNDVVPA